MCCLEMETDAARVSRLERHIAPGEIQFLTKLLLKHGNNYKVKEFRSYNIQSNLTD